MGTDILFWCHEQMTEFRDHVNKSVDFCLLHQPFSSPLQSNLSTLEYLEYPF